MLSSTSTLDYTINSLKRHIQEQFPNLTLHFLFSDSNNPRSIEEGFKKLQGHPEIDNIMSFWSSHQPRHFELCALFSNKKKGLFSHFSKFNYLALIHIDLNKLEYESNLAFPATPNRYEQVITYSLAWQAINLLRQLSDGTKQHKHKKTELFQPSSESIDVLKCNILGECFTIMFLEQYGEKGIIQQMMKKRCELCLVPNTQYHPENYPLPIAIDALRLIFEDLGNARPERETLISHTLIMLDEIESTIDEISLKQWVEFCLNAQEMAWDERSRNEILSAATYSTDDAHTRTTGYILAEALNTDTTPLNNPQFYNPFAESERYERLHNKLCQQNFETLLETTKPDELTSVLSEQIKISNAELFKNNILDWNAAGLVGAINELMRESATPNEKLIEVFMASHSRVSWYALEQLGRFIMLHRREGVEITSELIISDFSSERVDADLIYECLKI